MKKIEYKFHIDGMHCKSCALTIENDLMDLSYVSSARVDLSDSFVLVEGDFEGIPVDKIADDFSAMFIAKGYSFSVEKKETKKNWSEFQLAVPFALAFLFLFILLQKAGIVNLVNISKISFGTAFIIGVIASLSTCMAIVGGLVLSMSATFTKDGSGAVPITMFHIGRILSFLFFGGVIGLIGSAFQLGTKSTFFFSLLVGLVMLVMALNLLDFHIAKQISPSMPKFLSKYALSLSKLNHSFTPFIVGVATFFLPCGFTQSMQLYSLTTGSFFSGAITMFSFALGTLPVLSLVSFGSLSMQKSLWAGIFFKISGIIVLFFAVLNILNSLVVINIIPPIFNF